MTSPSPRPAPEMALPAFDPNDLELAQLTIGREQRHNPGFKLTRAFLQRRLTWGFSRSERILAELRRLSAEPPQERTTLPASVPEAPGQPVSAEPAAGAVVGRLTRYEPDMEGAYDTGYWGTMSSAKDGEYVLYDDFQKLEASHDRLRAALEEIEDIPAVAFTKDQKEMACRTIEAMQAIARAAIEEAKLP